MAEKSHNCIQSLEHPEVSPLNAHFQSDIPMVYVDGESFWKDGKYLTGFVVISGDGQKPILKRLPGYMSAQMAELEAVKYVLHFEPVNIYSDSAYMVNSLCLNMAVWARRGFINSVGKPLKHAPVLRELWALITQNGLQEKFSIVKIKAHQRCYTVEARGNALADTEAKQAAESGGGAKLRFCFGTKKSHLGL
ncbi:ribonuclease H-like [Protopterus annectens]|uniref:ribonuclease H-like n=1 Tax=Protopterus annectens TaxID=7888 RepID=UPI001CF96A01|nr:ribonuclease H-like [Protopterus annectens]